MSTKKNKILFFSSLLVSIVCILLITYNVYTKLSPYSITPSIATIDNIEKTPKSLSFSVSNQHDRPIYVGEWYIIEKNYFGKWFTLSEVGGYSYQDMLYEIKPDDSFDSKVRWGVRYGTLFPGKYRIIFNVYLSLPQAGNEPYFIASEFDIE